MKKCILITKKKHQDDIENFINENDITECLQLLGKSSNANFLIELLNLYNNGLVLYLLKLKEKQKKLLLDFFETDKKFKKTIMLELKKEKDMQEIEKNIQNKEKVDKKYSKLVVTILPSGFNEFVIDCVKEVGESGATIINGKGIGKNYSSFMGINLENEREIILVATNYDKSKKLLNMIRKILIKNNIKGVVFTTPLEDFKYIK